MNGWNLYIDRSKKKENSGNEWTI